MNSLEQANLRIKLNEIQTCRPSTVVFGNHINVIIEILCELVGRIRFGKSTAHSTNHYIFIENIVGNRMRSHLLQLVCCKLCNLEDNCIGLTTLV